MDRAEIETEAKLDAEIALQQLEDAEELQWRRHLARRAISRLIESVCAQVPQEVLDLAWGPTPDESDAKARLLCLADRVALFSPPIDAVPRDRLSLGNLSAEFRAIAHGDKAQITEPASFHGMREPNAFRLALHKLRALQWDAFLAAHNNSIADRHNAIADAYKSQWTAIYRWRKSIEKLLGNEWTAMSIKDAGILNRFGQSAAFSSVQPSNLLDQLRLDGEAYYKERKRQFSVVD